MTEDDKKTIRDRYNSVTGTVGSVQNAVNLFRDFRQKYNERFMYTATLDEDSFVYFDIMKYINARTNTRNFRLVSTREGVWRYYDSDATATFYIGEYKIKAVLRKPKVFTMGSSDEDYGSVLSSPSSSSGRKEELMFTCSSPEGLKALEDLLVSFTDAKQVGKKTSYIVNTDKWGDWDYEELPPKTLDSVFLPPGVKEDLLEDIDNFLSKEDRFKALGMPYHRGYCLYGDPGNGKSSVALALANHYNMDLYNLPLSAVSEDSSLTKSIAGLRKNSLLLLEDIDIFSSTMSRDGQENAKAPTLAGLLNALDGVSTPHGLIAIMTTNHFEKLDDALIRKGRMDYKLELKAPVPYQIDQMFRAVFEEPLNVEPRTFECMADVADVFKRNLDDPEAVRVELKND